MKIIEVYKGRLKDRLKIFHELEKMEQDFLKACRLIEGSIKSGGKILVAGNGGSASQSSHLTAELVWRFRRSDRKPIGVINLTSDVSTLTAISNDAGFKHSIEFQLEAYGNEGDVFIALSTSGKSPNVINALKKAREMRLKTVLMTGKNAPQNAADVVLGVPSDDTPAVQECHLFLIHAICEFIDETFGGKL